MDSRTAVFVAIGGVAGAAARWGLIEALDGGGWWPWGVLVANVAGCLVLGAVVAGVAQPEAPAVVGMTVGFCGALTTFAAFAVDIALWIDAGEWGRGLLYLIASFVAGAAAFVVGQRLALRVPSW